MCQLYVSLRFFSSKIKNFEGMFKNVQYNILWAEFLNDKKNTF